MNTDRLKFRVWDNELKEYVEYSAHDSVRMCLHPDGDLGYLYHDEEIRKAFNDGSLVVEQCTGLKDADGKLIYEGDILQTPSNTYFVRHDEKTCGFVCEYHIDDRMGLLLHSDLAFKKYRIVGNIHENPELLEAGK